MPKPGSNEASLFATQFLHTAIEAGVKHLVVSPGARSQALALAAAELDREGLMHLHVRHDERSAGFVALGLAITTGLPAIVITTSGSAVANLMPAVVEAHHAGIPMVIATGDRPASLRRRRSSQTTMQPGMFGQFVRAEWDLVANGPGAEPEPAGLAYEAMQMSVLLSGPVHVNVQFVEPLSGPIDPERLPKSGIYDLSETTASRPPTSVTLPNGPRTVIVAGFRAGEDAVHLAHETGWPLFAEVVSGSRIARAAHPHYRQMLERPELRSQIERVVVFGTPTLSRAAQLLLQDPAVEVIVVSSPGADTYQPAGRDAQVVDEVIASEEELPTDPDFEVSPEYVAWLRLVKTVSAELEAESAKQLEAEQSKPGISRAELVLETWAATSEVDRLVVGASRLIREADAIVPPAKQWVHSNRGQAGIDGTIATGLGVALAAAAGTHVDSTTRVLLGDVAALHDAGSMLLSPDQTKLPIQVIVGNDNGGSIFAELEVAETAPPMDFARVLTTPHSADLVAIAKGYGWNAVRVTSVTELRDSLNQSWDGPVLIEVPLDS